MRCNNPRFFNGCIVPCGHCMPCRINRREEWTTRICNETDFSSSACFITLTYRPEDMPTVCDDECGEPIFVPSKYDIQCFLKRLRKKYGAGIRFYIGSERGPSTNRPHYHGIIWNLPPDAIDNSIIEKIWGKGFVRVSEFTPERAAYVAKYYVEREDYKKDSVPDFSLMSRRPGIGARYVESNRESIGGNELSYCYRSRKKPKVPLPRYYRIKAYSEETKSKRLAEYISKQDFAEFQRRHRIGQELDALMARDYKSKHKKEL